MKKEENRYASENQLILSRLYSSAALIGLVLVTIIFALYVLGVVESRVPAREVASYWHLDAEGYAEETGIIPGWTFIHTLKYGENLSFGSLVFMALTVILCLSVMVVIFLRTRKFSFAVIVLLQIIVFVIAATGVVSAH